MITDQLIQLLRQHWPLVAFTVVVAWLVRNRYHNGLNKYPGPFLASLTDWWRFFDVYGRRPERSHIALHKKYGPVVRLGPNTLSFSDPEALKTIYGLNKGFIKVCLSLARMTGTGADGDAVRLLRGPAVGGQGPQLALAVQHHRQRLPHAVPPLRQLGLCHVGAGAVRAVRRQHDQAVPEADGAPVHRQARALRLHSVAAVLRL